MEFLKKTSKEDKKLTYKQGYIAVVEWLQAMSVRGSSVGSIDEVNKSIDFYFKLNTLAIIVFDIKFQKYKSLYLFKVRKQWLYIYLKL